MTKGSNRFWGKDIEMKNYKSSLKAPHSGYCKSSLTCAHKKKISSKNKTEINNTKQNNKQKTKQTKRKKTKMNLITKPENPKQQCKSWKINKKQTKKIKHQTKQAKKIKKQIYLACMISQSLLKHLLPSTHKKK